MCEIEKQQIGGLPMKNESQISIAIFIAKLYEISKLISVSIFIGNPPYNSKETVIFSKLITRENTSHSVSLE